MSYQIITRMAYNAESRQIETWQHSNNVWPKTDTQRNINADSDSELFNMLVWLAGGEWQGRKWQGQRDQITAEFPCMDMAKEWAERDAATAEARATGGNWYAAGCAVSRRYDEERESNKAAICARFRELVGIPQPTTPATPVETPRISPENTQAVECTTEGENATQTAANEPEDATDNEATQKYYVDTYGTPEAAEARYNAAIAATLAELEEYNANPRKGGKYRKERIARLNDSVEIFRKELEDVKRNMRRYMEAHPEITPSGVETDAQAANVSPEQEDADREAINAVVSGAAKVFYLSHTVKGLEWTVKFIYAANNAWDVYCMNGDKWEDEKSYTTNLDGIIECAETDRYRISLTDPTNADSGRENGHTPRITSFGSIDRLYREGINICKGCEFEHCGSCYDRCTADNFAVCNRQAARFTLAASN